MLFGLANDLVLPAVLMVVAISAGMAVAMSLIGLAAIMGRDWVEGRFQVKGGTDRRFEVGARIAGAGCVLVIGVMLFTLTLSHTSQGTIQGQFSAVASR
jgi:ABC-type nickel/cobalt efflux system permease component RcnA